MMESDELMTFVNAKERIAAAVIIIIDVDGGIKIGDADHAAVQDLVHRAAEALGMSISVAQAVSIGTSLATTMDIRRDLVAVLHLDANRRRLDADTLDRCPVRRLASDVHLTPEARIELNLPFCGHLMNAFVNFGKASRLSTSKEAASPAFVQRWCGCKRRPLLAFAHLDTAPRTT